MVCEVKVYEKPKLNNPVLIEGLPGIGFVANIAALHLINELNAKCFTEISSSSFKDFALATDTGSIRFPINKLYYCKRGGRSHDLMIWYGNTQALTTFGQYELCNHVLSLAQELGCRLVITLGGFKKEEIKATPEIYCAASDHEALTEALSLKTKIMVGHIFGIAGISIGLAKLKGLKGFSLLVETAGLYPDSNAAHHALLALDKYLNLSIDLSRLENTVEETKKLLGPFGLIRSRVKEKEKKEQQLRWFV